MTAFVSEETLVSFYLLLKNLPPPEGESVWFSEVKSQGQNLHNERVYSQLESLWGTLWLKLSSSSLFLGRVCRAKSGGQSIAVCLPRFSTHILEVQLTLCKKCRTQLPSSLKADHVLPTKVKVKVKVKQGLLQPQPHLGYWCAYLNVSCVCTGQGQAVAAGAPRPPTQLISG